MKNTQRAHRAVIRRTRFEASALAAPAQRKGFWQAFVAVCTTLCLVFSLLSVGAPQALAQGTRDTLGKVADTVTAHNWESVLGSAEQGTRNSGNIWTDKSVAVDSLDFSESDGIKGATFNNDSDFLLSYSALGSTSVVNGEDTVPTDLMVVMDMSGSMGYKNSNGETGMQAMIPALNKFIHTYLEANQYNRIGFVAYDSTAYVLMPLDRYSSLPDENGAPVYDSEGNLVYIKADDHHEQFWGDAGPSSKTTQTASVLTTNVRNSAGEQWVKQVTSWTNTNTQAGLYAALDQLAGVDSTEVELENKRTIQRRPSVVLMTDGAANTIMTGDYAEATKGVSAVYTGGPSTKYPSAQAGEADAGEFRYLAPYSKDDTSEGLVTYGAAELHKQTGSNGLTLLKTIMSAAAKKVDVMQKYGIDANDAEKDEKFKIATVAYNLGIASSSSLGYFYGVTYGSVSPKDYFTDSADKLSEIPSTNPNDSNKPLYSSDVIFNPNAVPAEGDEFVMYGGNDLAPVSEDKRSVVPGAYQIFQQWEHNPRLVLKTNKNFEFALGRYDAAVAANIAYNTSFATADTGTIDGVLNEIVGDLGGEAVSPVTDTAESASNDGLVYTDLVGEYMEVKDVKALLLFGKMYDIVQISRDENTTRWAVSSEETVTNEALGSSFSLTDIKITAERRDDTHQLFTISVPEEAVPLIKDEVSSTISFTDSKPTKSTTIKRTEAKPLRVIYSIGIDDDVKLADGSVDLSKIDANYIAKNTDEDKRVRFYSNAFGIDDDAALENIEATYGMAKTVFNPSQENSAYYFQHSNTLYKEATKDVGATFEELGYAGGDEGALGALKSPVAADEKLEADADYYYLVSYYVPNGDADGEGNKPAKLTYEILSHKGSELESSAEPAAVAVSFAANAASADLKVTEPGSPRAGVLNSLAAEKGDGNMTETASYVSRSTYSDNDVDGTTTNVTTSLGNNGQLRVAAPGLEIEKHQALNGGEFAKDTMAVELENVVTYRLTVTNPAETMVTDAVVSDEIPGDLQLMDGSVKGVLKPADGSANFSVSGSRDNGVVAWHVGDMKPGDVAELSFEAKVPAGTTHSEWVNQGFATFSNNPAGADARVPSNEVKIVRGKPVVTVVKAQAPADGDMTTDKLEVQAGNEVTYQLTVANDGDIPARDVLVRDQVPAGLTLIAGSASDGGSIKGDTVSWSFEVLQPGEKRSLTFKVTVPKVSVATKWTNVAAVSFGNNPDGPDVEVKSNSVEADIALAKNAPAPGTKLPQTGDGLFLLAALLFGLAAVAGVGALAIRRRS